MVFDGWLQKVPSWMGELLPDTRNPFPIEIPHTPMFDEELNGSHRGASGV